MITINLTDPPLPQAAAGYSADHLWSVLPCEPGGKRPLWGLGWEEASSDPETIMAWWAMEPRANIGVACIGDLVVLDVDGPEGEALLAEHEPLPDTYEVHTGRTDGGRHLYFRRPEGLTEGWRYRGLELKASGYVLAPPSVHPSGAWYYAHHPEVHLEELPGWLREAPRPPRMLELPLPDQPQDSKRLQGAARAALTGELAKLGTHGREPGSHRHTALYAAAAALGAHVEVGSISQAEVEGALWEAAPQLLGLAQDAEAWHQIQSGLADGRAEPYVLTERPMPPRTSSAGYVREQPPAPEGRAARLRAMAEIKLESVEWLWPQRIPLGKLTVLAGLPGQGKSLLTCWLASRVSRGVLEGGPEDPLTVLMVSAEDDPEDTILPRLLRTGADTSRVYAMDVREHAAGRDYTRSVSLPGDTPAILEALEVTGAKLLVLDPIGGLLSVDHSAYNAQQVRAALGPLQQAAVERHAAVVLVSHVLTKGQSTDPLARLADSHAFAGLPRSVLIFGPDPEDEQGDRGSSKVLTLAKSNLAERGEHGLRFSLLEGGMVSDGRGGLGWTASIRLDGATDATASDSLASGEDRTALREAIEFLREVLADGPMRSGALRAEAESQGISQRTLERARAKVCRRAYREGTGPWMTALRDTLGDVGGVGGLGAAPDDAKTAKDAKDAKGAGDTATVLSLFPGREPDQPGQPDGPEL